MDIESNISSGCARTSGNRKGGKGSGMDVYRDGKLRHNKEYRSGAKVGKDFGVWSQLIDQPENISENKTDLIKKLHGENFVGQSKEVMDKRAQDWNNLFTRLENIPDGKALDIFQDDDFKYVDNEEEEEEDQEEAEEGEDEEEEEENDENNSTKNEYYTKPRHQMKKHPLLVQYWINTGNPPYRLTDDDSETGESLSEDDKNEKFEEPQPDKTRLEESSVDTAAYIRSNANVTTKADALAIIEGSKVLQEAEIKIVPEAQAQDVPEDDANDKINNNTDKKTSSPKKTSPSPEKKLVNSQDSKQSINHHVLNYSNNLESSKIKSPKSPMKLSDAVRNLDKLLSPLKTVCENNFKTSDSLDNETEIKTPHQIPTRFRRRKLYTGRESPVDINLSSVKKKSKPLFKLAIHPAFHTTPSPKVVKVVRQKRRLTMKPERRRSSRLSTKKRQSKEGGEKSPKKLAVTPVASARKLEEKHKRNSDSFTIFDAKADDHLEKLKNLCLTKRPVVCLDRIPTDAVTIPSRRVELIKNDTDSQGSDQSTILIVPIKNEHFKKLPADYKRTERSRFKNPKNMKRKRRKVKPKNVEIKRKHTDSILEDIRNIFDDTKIVRNPDGTLTSRTEGRFFISICDGESSDDDAGFVRPLNLTRKNTTIAPAITFSSDEDDDFTKFVNHNRTKMLQEETLKESLNVCKDQEEPMESSTTKSPEISPEKVKVFSKTLTKSSFVKALEFSDESSDSTDSEKIIQSSNKKMKTNSNSVINKYTDSEDNNLGREQRKNDENCSTELKKSQPIISRKSSPILSKSVAVKSSFSEMISPQKKSLLQSAEEKLKTSPIRNLFVKPVDNNKKRLPSKKILVKSPSRIFSMSCDDEDESSDENIFYRGLTKATRAIDEDSETENNNTGSCTTGSSDNPTKIATKLLNPSLHQKLQKPNTSLYSNYQATMTFCTNRSSDSDD